MNSIPLPMSHEELVKAFSELRDDYYETKLRLNRLVKMFDHHIHDVDQSAITGEARISQTYFNHRLKE